MTTASVLVKWPEVTLGEINMSFRRRWKFKDLLLTALEPLHSRFTGMTRPDLQLQKRPCREVQHAAARCLQRVRILLALLQAYAITAAAVT
ncbi:MAG: hypothetical protein ABIO38_07435 [Luteimonas sp.]